MRDHLNDAFVNYLTNSFNRLWDEMTINDRRLSTQRTLMRCWEKGEYFDNIKALQKNRESFRIRLIALRDRLLKKGIDLNEEYDFTYFLKKNIYENKA